MLCFFFVTPNRSAFGDNTSSGNISHYTIMK